MGGVECKLYKAINNYTRNGISLCILLMERMLCASRKHQFYSGWLMALIAIMLPRLVVSLFILNICGVRLLCL